MRGEGDTGVAQNVTTKLHKTPEAVSLVKECMHAVSLSLGPVACAEFQQVCVCMWEARSQGTSRASGRSRLEFRNTYDSCLLVYTDDDQCVCSDIYNWPKPLEFRTRSGALSYRRQRSACRRLGGECHHSGAASRSRISVCICDALRA